MNEVPYIEFLFQEGTAAYEAADSISAEKFLKEAKRLSDLTTSETTNKARKLLNQGVDFGYRHPDQAIECFRQAKALASDNQTGNTARLYLACVYNFRHTPGLRRAESAENDNFLLMAAAEFKEVLENNPSERDRAYAESNIKLIQNILK